MAVFLLSTKILDGLLELGFPDFSGVFPDFSAAALPPLHCLEMASEWCQSRERGTIHTRNCITLADGGEAKARAVVAALRNPESWDRWWPADLTIKMLPPKEDKSSSSPRIRVCSRWGGVCWEGQVQLSAEASSQSKPHPHPRN